MRRDVTKARRECRGFPVLPSIADRTTVGSVALRAARVTTPGMRHDVMRIEHDNIERQVRETGRKIEQLDARIDELSKQLSDLVRLVDSFRTDR